MKIVDFVAQKEINYPETVHFQVCGVVKERSLDFLSVATPWVSRRQSIQSAICCRMQLSEIVHGGKNQKGVARKCNHPFQE